MMMNLVCWVNGKVGALNIMSETVVELCLELSEDDPFYQHKKVRFCPFFSPVPPLLSQYSSVFYFCFSVSL